MVIFGIIDLKYKLQKFVVERADIVLVGYLFSDFIFICSDSSLDEDEGCKEFLQDETGKDENKNFILIDDPYALRMNENPFVLIFWSSSSLYSYFASFWCY